MHDRKTIGFIGTGKMGRPMIANLIAASYPVIAFNRSPQSLQHVESAGAARAASISKIAETADIIISSLTNQQSVRDVYLGADGLVANCRPAGRAGQAGGGALFQGVIWPAAKRLERCHQPAEPATGQNRSRHGPVGTGQCACAAGCGGQRASQRRRTECDGRHFDDAIGRLMFTPGNASRSVR